MNENEKIEQGLSERILRELLRSPRSKAALKILLSGIDPSSGPGLVRTLFREDPEIFLAVISAAPAIINLLLQVLREMAAQLGSFPPALLRKFTYQILADINGRTLGEAAGGFVTITLNLKGEEDEGAILAGVAEDIRSGYRAARAAQGMAGGSLAPLAEGVGRALRENPDFVNQVLKPIVAGLRDASPEIFG